MRLINTTTLGIEIFFDGHAPPYAILSHRWHDGEVSLQEMESGTAVERPGYAKIVQTCALAARDGLGYAWVDTCCIDKTSSAELSVAINSMYRWYREAVVCYAFLSDVEFDDVEADAGAAAFSNSAWFSRGWTLQELLAPAKVEFYNVSWHKIGTKATLSAAIEAITGIDLIVLKGSARLSVFSIARRMSWAAGRKTTVPEDTAYCLFGLFGVNMPMLYGEGEKAFIRLQEEIMKNSEDQSLFAWTSKEPYAQGLLARSPDDFAACGDIVMVRKRWNRIPYSVTNLGLSIQLPMMPWAMDTYLVTLDCRNEDEPDSRVAIFLRLLSRPNQLLRVPFEEGDRSVFKDEMVEKLTYRDVFVHQPPPGVIMIPTPLYGFYLRNFSAPILTVRTTTDSEIPLSKVWSQCDWDDEKRLLELPVGESGTVGMISWSRQDGNGWFMKFGFDFEFNPVLQLGGDMVSPNRPLTMDPNSVEAWMNPTWMDGPAHSKYLHKADRMIGLEEEVFIASMRISIMLEEIDDTGKRAWIVDIVDHKSKYPRHADLCEGYVNEGISVRKLPKSS